MATYYISPSGNDSTGAGSSGNPWLTLNKAVGSSASGDTIVLKNGTYTSLFTGAMVSMSSRTIQAETASQAIITAAFNSTTLPTYGYLISVGNTYTVTMSGLKFLNCTGSNATSLFQSVYGGSFVMDDCVWENLTTTSGGFYILKHGGTFRNSLVNGFSLDAGTSLFYVGSGNTLNVKNSSFYTSSLAANTYLFTNSGTAVVKNCIFQNAASPQTITFRNSTTITAQSVFCKNILSLPSGVSTIAATNVFVDAANGDFHLPQDSELLGMGTYL